MGSLFDHFGQAQVTGEPLGGLLLGGLVLGWTWPAAENWLMPNEGQSQVIVTAHLGLVILTFGLGAERRDLERSALDKKAIIRPGFTIPVGRGQHAGRLDRLRGLCPFSGPALSITAVPVVARVS